jgi:hypothetical protein
MKINGTITFSPAVKDAAGFHLLIAAEDNQQGKTFTVPVNADGSFSMEDEAFSSYKILFISVFYGGTLLKNCGSFMQSQWENIVITDVPYTPAKEEETSSSVQIKGYLYDDTAAVQSFSGYKVEVRYQLSGDNDIAVSNRVSASAMVNGNFELKLLQEISGSLKAGAASPLEFILTDSSGNQVEHEVYLVNGQEKTKTTTLKLADLNPGQRLLSTAVKRDLPKMEWAKSAQQLNTGLVELRFHSLQVQQGPVTVKEKPLVNSNRKLRGRVVDKSAKVNIRNNQVILYAEEKSGDDQQTENKKKVVGVCMTDGQGNFSVTYPVGMFAAAYAVVSIKPDEIKEIVLNPQGEFPDFVWLILESLPEEMTQEEHDDCACKAVTPTLPDMEELLENSAYAQDIGGSCTNFTTPNRALEEFTYKMVIRTSDPELFDLDETTLRDRIASVNARITSINQQLNGFSYYAVTTINFDSIAETKYLLSADAQKKVADTKKDDPKVRSSVKTVTDYIKETPLAMNLAYNSPAKEFLSNKINNENARLLRIELVYLQKELQKLNRLLSYKGRVPLDGKNPIDWDDSDNTLGVVQASTIAFGHILNYKQVWRAAGYSLGDLLYSLPLAPGQKKQIAVFDWDRKESASRTESMDYNDNLQNSMSHTRDISEIVNSNLNENTSAESHNKTKGSSMGAGVGAGTAGSGAGAGSFSGFSVIGAATGMLGISGGANKSSGESWSDASQNSMRNLSASTNQNLRDNTMQNASSLRSQRSSVVTTVSQGESFSITTEVVANHNHCHAITIQYFEVLRHYAIHQELSDVQECLFIPMFIDDFDRRKILRWRDILSTYLFAPSDKIKNMRAGFDALQRAEDAEKGDPDAYADFPTARYCDENLTDIFGDLKFNLHVVRPIETVIPNGEAAPTLEQRKQAVIDAFINGGLAWLPGIREIGERLVYGLEEKMEENFQKELMWAQLPEEYTKFLKVRLSLKSSSALVDLYADVSLVSKKDLGQNSQDPNKSRAGIFELGISIQPTSTTINILQGISREDIRAVVISNSQDLPFGSSCLLQYGSLHYKTEHYAGSLFANNYISNDIAAGDSAYISTPLSKDELRNPMKEDKKNADLLFQHLNTNREHYHTKLWLLLDEQRLFNLLDKYSIQVPKLRYANGTKDGESVYGLVLDANGNPVIDYETRSVASVVEMKRLGMAGNSIIFPVARGLNMNKDFLLIPEFSVVEEVTIPAALSLHTQKILYFDKDITRISYSKIGVVTGESRVDLVDLYKPLPGTAQEPKPFRISVPTKGLFAEAVAGACNSCEKIDDSRFWKWEEHPIDEPTAIQPISTDSRRADTGDLTAKDFPAPMINIQAAPAAPDPQGLANALMLMGKSDIFKDITGLDQTQKNALQSLLSNQEAAKFFGEQAAKLAIEAGKNTQHAADTVANYDLAKRGQQMQALDKIQGLPLDSDTKQKYYDDAMGKILGNDDNVSDTLGNALKNKDTDSITDQSSIDHHADQGRDVEATRTTNGKTETIKVKGNTGSSQPQDDDDTPADPDDDDGDGSGVQAEVTGITPLQQDNANACWATAATMMMSWKKAQSLTIQSVLAEAGDEYLQLFNNGEGLKATEKEPFILALDMEEEERATNYPLQTYINLMKKHGPLWVTTDSSSDSALFSPHARILVKISGSGNADGTDTEFVFNDPLTGTAVTESFAEFTSAFEQMATDNTGQMFMQIVHFKDEIEPADGEGEEGTEGGGNQNVQLNNSRIQQKITDLNWQVPRDTGGLAANIDISVVIAGPDFKLVKNQLALFGKSALFDFQGSGVYEMHGSIFAYYSQKYAKNNKLADQKYVPVSDEHAMGSTGYKISNLLNTNFIFDTGTQQVIEKSYRSPELAWSSTNKESYNPDKVIIHAEEKDFPANKTLINWAGKYNNGGIRKEPYPAYGFKYARPKNQINQIILHETAGFGGLTYNGEAGFCAQLGVLRDATILQYFDLAEYQQHTGADFSNHSVGIEFANNPWANSKLSVDQSGPQPSQQEAAVMHIELLKLPKLIERHTDSLYLPVGLQADGSVDLNQLESLVELMRFLIDEFSIPLKWHSLIKAPDSSVGDTSTESYFIFSNAHALLPKSQGPGIYAHGVVASLGGHADGFIQNFYSWLRLACNLSPQEAYQNFKKFLTQTEQREEIVNNQKIIKTVPKYWKIYDHITLLDVSEL